jgi:glycosyltransferase involved in cell wall biosynthesis
METRSARKRLLIFVVAYNAEKTIQSVLRRIPPALSGFDTHILVIDDSSKDGTFEKAYEFDASPFPTTVLFNPRNQGYGGNQKIGFHFAVKKRFDYVALLHGDGQYAPECLPELLAPLLHGDADAVLGSRMMARGDALKGGMPVYKFVGNKILTYIQNKLLKTRLSEFHSGYRVYSVEALASTPFECNTNDFHFDTEIIIQLIRGGCRIAEIPIPTYYGDEICHVNGLKYAFNVIKASTLARAQDVGVLYQRKFDVRSPLEFSNYQPKFDFRSSHRLALDVVSAGSSVVDIGCASGYMARELNRKGCRVTGVDQYPPSEDVPLERFIRHDLDDPKFPVDMGSFEFVLLLDVLEHLHSPETFVDALRSSRRDDVETRVIASTGNVAFFVTRLTLLAGAFRYGRRGILDLTHTRLFTFATFRQLFQEAGYAIEEVQGIPAPYPLALGDNALSRFLLWINRLLIKVSKSLFSYQIFMVVRPLPSLEWLLRRAMDSKPEKAARQ